MNYNIRTNPIVIFVENQANKLKDLMIFYADKIERNGAPNTVLNSMIESWSAQLYSTEETGTEETLLTAGVNAYTQTDTLHVQGVQVHSRLAFVLD